jgi:hypothetical protein
MSIAHLIQRMKRYEKNAEMIFDTEEPIGTPTDLVMPRRRWFRRNKPAPGSLEAKILQASKWKR